MTSENSTLGHYDITITKLGMGSYGLAVSKFRARSPGVLHFMSCIPGSIQSCDLHACILRT